MNTLVIIAVIIILVAILITLFKVFIVGDIPDGWEDEEAFHYGIDPRHK